ncbi:erythrocyte membrane protein 1 [Plasmodium falciparum RAJ116]|uniref:Erythrocyte membrane protein 1 n=1 Tax=Plasmodium falciparum RAJ116 TaxID=580058 RepID=A0A0L0CSA6_PLAFA|nr:erythrocyte membrane protein 1 [Plasmodium falciparum RAJ116]
MAPGGLLGGGGGTQDDSVKDLFDRIGRTIQQEVNKAAKTYTSELHGDLSKATYPGDENPEKSTPQDPCDLEHSLHTNVTIGGDKEYPCEKRSNVRFSDKEGAECNKSKIKDSKSNCGACAPYRRLHLCDRNLENINDYSKINTKDNLLLEVCLAAKYEGDSIIGEYPKYQNKYGDSGFTTCTMLARSFADIGDIVRGKDLYLGDNRKDREQKQKLQENLNKIFNDIKKNNQSKLGRLSLDQIREYWWEENREKIWKAITCKAQGYKYFLPKCSKDTWSQDKCRCANTGVPTNFDYVPQYLRWFEEWAEDFCRKKNKKLENVKKQCRKKDKNSDDRYCSRNGYDCEQTVNARGKLRYGKQCISCLYGCNPYVEWIENQRKQFLKQKKKYDEEIKKYTNGAVGSGGSRRQRRGAGGTTTTNYDGYEKKFYNKLKDSGYEKVDAFLGLLNNEKACTNINDNDGGTIHFEKVNSGGTSDTSGTNDIKNGTFYRSEYCQPCPDCGVKKKDGGKWEPKKEDEKCKSGNIYKPKNGKSGTPIEILKSGDETNEIAEKLKKFCQAQNGSVAGGSGGARGNGASGDKNGGSGSQELYEEWKCYKHNEVQKVNVQDDDDDGNYVKAAGGLCILENKNKEESQSNSQNNHADIQKTYNDFFYYWVAHMLKDSIHWRTKKIKKCLENGKTMKCKEWCNKDCVCFQKWVNRKRTEWGKIKEQFSKQEGIPGGCYFTTLEGVLQIEFLKGDSEDGSAQDKQNSLDEEEAEELKHLRQMLQKENAQGTAGDGLTCSASDNEKETIMDKLIDYEEGIANNCLQKCQETQPESPLRSLQPIAREDTPPPHTESDSAEHDEDEDDEEEEDEDEEVKETVAEVEETTATEGPDVCKIVGDALTDQSNLTDACKQKYQYGKEKYTNWKCISSGSDASGSICIPPRRRRLYVGKLETLDTDSALQNDVKTPSDKLRTAFIQSAAIETFFLWHKYKAEKEIEKKEKNTADGTVYKRSEDPEQKELEESGKIPEEFKRQMFYTLGDYRDIIVRGGHKDGSGKEIVVHTSGNKEDMEKIQHKIKEHINSVSKPSVQTPKEWWEQHGKHIWEGMICALTYDTDSGAKGTSNALQQIEGAQNLLNKIKEETGTEGEYHYEKVKLDEQSSDGQMSTGDAPKLTEFVKRPTYFRWLEEWGEEFCRKQKHKLYIIEKDCRGKYEGEKYCSGDGLRCDEEVPENEKIYEAFHCPSCAKSCRFYRKWINTKKKEYEKQQNAYNEQKKNCEKESGGGGTNKFCVKLGTCTTAAAFLNRLKNGPCKKDDDNNDNGEDEIDFKEKVSETFQHTKLCGTCSEVKKNCQNDNCSKVIANKCINNMITAENIKNMNKDTEINMLVSDYSTNGVEGDLNEACKRANIFEGIKENKWECRKVCGVDICTLEKENNNGEESNEHIIVKELLKRWLEYFFEDYNKINKKLNSCIKNGNGEVQKCFKGCKKNCECVEKWVKEKKKEWEKIKEHYIDQYKKQNDGGNTLTNFLEILIPETHVKKATGREKISDFERSSHCNGSAKPEMENGKKRDVVVCLLDKLEKEAEKCKTKHSGQTCTDTPQPQTLEDETLDDDIETEEVKAPNICPTRTEPPEEEESCDAQPPEPNIKEEEEEKEEEKEKGNDQEGRAPSPPAPAPAAPPAAPLPPLKTALVTSTLAWSIGIGFATFTYFFLKKKTKASVGNLFQILQIPKGDYDIPTLKSKNRYIPYRSGTYKGKTYIYMEGDSSGDEKYAFMSDTTDITSSESEYEEMDINDIYVPGSPKYKTLIEVVLEPSGNNTTASGKNTPSDTQNDIHNDIPSDIPNSDTPPPITDDEWNKLKKDFISNMLQNTQNTEPNILRDNVDNNTNTTMSRDNMEEKPFIMSIHDRDLYTGEEYNYDMFNSGNNPINISDSTNSMDSLTSNNHGPYNDKNDLYSENELFGTNHPKHTNTHNVTKSSNSDPIDNQLNLFHQWLDRHRDMCEKWNNKEELLDKLKEEWNKDNNTGDIHTSDSNKTLNTDVSIQIDMNNPKYINQFTYVDSNPNVTLPSNPNLVENQNPNLNLVENNINPNHQNQNQVGDTNFVDTPTNPTNVQIEMSVKNTQMMEENYPIEDVWYI